jgi:hypothetical protein
MTVLALVATLLFAAAEPAAEAPVELPPATVLARYTAALAAFSAPAVLSFDYTLEQSGARDMEQTHRVFRSGANERDETLDVDGRKLDPPTTRIFRGRPDHYTVALLAPQPSRYDFTYLGPHRDGRHLDYVFDAVGGGSPAYRVTRVTIDGVTFLPRSVDFKSGATGTGSVIFGPDGHWWVPLEVSASATVDGLAASERLSFTNYRFPPSLPTSTFAAPRPLPSFAPIAGE